MERALRAAERRLQEISDEVIQTQKKDLEFKERLFVQVEEAKKTLDSLRDQATQSNTVILGAEQKAIEFRGGIEPIEKNFEAFVLAIESRFQISATMKLWKARAGKWLGILALGRTSNSALRSSGGRRRNELQGDFRHCAGDACCS